jgi:pilus assembly protein CpaB
MKRRIVMVAAAILLALVGTFAVYSYANGADKRAVAGSAAAVVLIAQKPVPAGTTWQDAVNGGYLKAEKMPASSAPESALSKVDSGVPDSDVTSAEIPAGQIVLRQMFGTESAKTGVLAIPKNLILITVLMPSNSDVAGFVEPKSEVAIFTTFKLNSASNTRPTNVIGTDVVVTKLLLPRVLVTAASQAPPTDAQGSAASASTAGGSVLVTLAVTQADAQRVILAQQVGELYFALLSDTSVTAVDNGVVNTVGALRPQPFMAK